MKIVLDSNVLISGVVFGGVPRKILEYWIEGEFDILLSDSVFEEYDHVIRRKKFQIDYITIQNVLEYIAKDGKWIQVKTQIEIVKDKTDNKFFSLAIDGQADYLVSGDALVVETKQEIVRVLTPKAFLEVINQKEQE